MIEVIYVGSRKFGGCTRESKAGGRCWSVAWPVVIVSFRWTLQRGYPPDIFLCSLAFVIWFRIRLISLVKTMESSRSHFTVQGIDSIVIICLITASLLQTMSLEFLMDIILGRTMPLTEMSTRDMSWGLRWPVPRADNLAAFVYRLSRNCGSLSLLEPPWPVKACNGIPLL